MTRARRQALMILLGVICLTLAIIVLVRNRSPDDELLAILGLVGGVAIVVVTLPGNGDR
jgi:uncharacterized membrane protein